MWMPRTSSISLGWYRQVAGSWKALADGVQEARHRPAQEHTAFGLVDLIEKGTTPSGMIIFILALPVEVAVSKTILTTRSDWRSVMVDIVPSVLTVPVPERVISCLPQRVNL